VHRSLAASAAALSLGLALSGCVSLFPKAPPVQLYRLSEAAPPPAVSAPPGLALAKSPTVFPSEAAGDRLLTVTGQQAAFIADARWLEPAAVMFDEAVADAFDQPGAPRLAGRGEALDASLTLRLEVRRFETDYDKGLDAAPTVDVAVHAVLIRVADRQIVAEQMFETRTPARDNRVADIVAAYNDATARTLGQMRDWTSASAAAAARP
jgi:cholesterol transport system auxiliary component